MTIAAVLNYLLFFWKYLATRKDQTIPVIPPGAQEQPRNRPALLVRARDRGKMPRRSGRLPGPAKNARNLSGAPGTGKKSPEKIQQGVAARKKEKKTLNNK